MNLTYKFLIGFCLLLIIIQILFVRYNMKADLWLNGTNKIVIQENITQKQHSIIIENPNVIKEFKKYFENTRISYVYGMYTRKYKIILSNGVQNKVYGYKGMNHVVDYGNSPGSLTLTVRIYKMESLAFNSFITSILKEKHMDKRSLKLSLIGR